MNVLVLGNGAREHALAWKIQQSPLCKKVILHPGNAGTEKAGFTHFGSEIQSKEDIAERATEAQVNLIVIGPEWMLDQGFADFFRNKGFLVVGPGQKGAKLETSKVFSKEFMKRAQVPTAPFKVAHTFSDLEKLLPNQFPAVLKVDGLAAGKGVAIPKNKSEALDFGRRVFENEEFGPTPQKLLLEEFIPGQEISYIGFCDGKTFIPCESATDYKRVFDHDEGPNTGGMGVISPSPYLTPSLQNKINETIISPVLKTLQKENIDYRGILYVGLMIDANKNPQILEFNARFGDPETEAVLLRLKSDLLPVLLATAKGELASIPPLEWSPEASVYIVGAAEGYPSAPKKGDIIGGIESVPTNTVVFYSSVARKEDFLVTSGGRVLGVGAVGTTLEEARQIAYVALKKIHWRGMHFRNDIGLTKEKTCLS